MDTLKQTIIGMYNLEALPTDKQDEMIQEIGSLIFQNVLMRVVPSMSDAKQSELEKMFETNSTPESLFAFLNQEVSDFQMIVSEEAKHFKEESESIMSQIGK